MSRDVFQRTIQRTLDELPEQFRSHLDNVEIIVESECADDPSLYGLYVGIPLPERMTGSTDFMLMDAVRERDELTTHKAVDRGTMLRVERAATEADALEPLHTTLCGRLQTPMSIAQLIETSPESDSRLLNAVYQLKAKGIIAFTT